MAVVSPGSPPLNDAPLDVSGAFNQSWQRWLQLVSNQLAELGSLSSTPSYANDAAAAAAGVLKGHLYRTASGVAVRVV